MYGLLCVSKHFKKVIINIYSQPASWSFLVATNSVTVAAVEIDIVITPGRLFGLSGCCGNGRTYLNETLLRRKFKWAMGARRER